MMMKNNLAKWLLILMGTIFGSVSWANGGENKSNGLHVKALVMDLNGVAVAFTHDDVTALTIYRNNSNMMISNLASAAIFRLRGDYRRAIESMDKCVSVPVRTGVDGYIHVACFWILAGMKREKGDFQGFYVAKREGCRYMKSHFQSITKYISRQLTGVDGVVENKIRGCARLGYFLGNSYLPKASYLLENNWSELKLNNGYATLDINGKDVNFLIDTGDGEMTINCNTNRSLCNEMRSVGLKSMVGDFTRSFAIETRVAKSVRFGPLSINNAYINITYNGPSTVGLLYLRYLGDFVLTNGQIANGSSIPRRSSPRSSQCVALNYEYGAVWAWQPSVMVKVATDVGDFNLLLDTGSKSSADMPNTSLFLHREMLADHPLVDGKVFKKQRVARTQHGLVIPMNVAFFHFALTGLPRTEITGLVRPGRDYASENSDGVLGGGLLDQVAMWMDFGSRRICFFHPAAPDGLN